MYFASLLGKTQKVLTTPGMLNAYTRWFFHQFVLTNRPALCVTSNTQICTWLNFSEYWSFRHGIPQSEKVFIEKCLNKTNSRPSVAIDIGANIGLFTIFLAELGYSQVHAFEPVPQTFDRLKLNLASNQLLEKVKLNCIALGSQEGFVEFQIFEKSPAINRFISPSDRNLQNNYSLKRVTVNTLDRYCDDNHIDKIDFLKIDVEGMEPLVVQGAYNILTKKGVSNILMEICPANLENAGTDINQLYNSLIKVGYFPHILLENGEIGEKLAVEDLKKMRLANVVVIPEVE